MSDLPAGRELDALIAAKVMGIDLTPKPDHDWDKPTDAGDYHTWKSCRRCYRFEYTCGCENDPPASCVAAFRYYSTDIAAAWEVVVKLADGIHCGFDLTLDWDGGWDACFEYAGQQKCVVVNQDNAPLAICRAALKAVSA